MSQVGTTYVVLLCFMCESSTRQRRVQPLQLRNLPPQAANLPICASPQPIIIPHQPVDIPPQISYLNILLPTIPRPARPFLLNRMLRYLTPPERPLTVGRRGNVSEMSHVVVPRLGSAWTGVVVLPDAELHPSEGTVQGVFVGMEGRVVGVLLRVGFSESARERSIGSTLGFWSNDICDFWRCRPLFGIEHSKSTSCCGTFRDLALVIEDIRVCPGRLLPLPARIWGVSHKVRVIS